MLETFGPGTVIDALLNATPGTRLFSLVSQAAMQGTLCAN
jgi:hypothetical protein